MSRLLKTIVKRALPRPLTFGLILYSNFARDPASYLQATGWLQSSFRGHPVGADGEPVPWVNYPMISLLKRRLPRGAVMFEFGSGHSTAFWSRLVSRVYSVECDETWFTQVAAGLPPNASVRLYEPDVDGRYCRSIAEPAVPFDAVVVDGRDRVNCVRQALQCLSEGGVIILDDSERPYYREAFELAEAAGFRNLSIEGPKPSDSISSEATVFYRPHNCLGL